MKKIIFLIGLMGSGKTFLGEQLCRQTNGLFLDDICLTCGPKRLKEPFDSDIIIVADPSLCRKMNRHLAENMVNDFHHGCEIEWIYFENNPEQCWNNVQKRNDGREISKHSIDALSRIYVIPDNARVIKVWQTEHHIKQDFRYL